MILTLFVILLIVWVLKINSDRRKFPPGPFNWPIIGHLLYVREEKRVQKFHHLTWAALAQRYGHVVGLRLGKVTVVLVSCPTLARLVGTNPDLQGRPDGFFYRMRAKGGRGGLVFNEGSTWADQKRFCITHLRDFGLGRSKMETLVNKEAETLLEWIGSTVDAPVNMDRVFDISVLNVLWAMLAGKRYPRDHVQLNRICEAICESFRIFDMTGGLLNQLPFVRFFAPDLSGYTQIKRNLLELNEFLQEVIDEHKMTINNGEIRDLIDAILHEVNTGGNEAKFSESDLYMICLDLLQAGMDTTSNTMSFFILYMMIYPDIQKNIQKEIDQVIGQGVVSLTDKNRLPYVVATIQEVQRLANIAPTGVAHRATKETTLGNYTIPKDTVVLTLLHDIHVSHDWGDPDTFRPERFLDENGQIKNTPMFMAFGNGKRRCVGEILAKSTMFAFVVSIFQSFSVQIPPGKSSMFEINDGVTLSPKPYTALWKKRST